MRPKSEPKVTNKKKILLICEGENTEPLFFDELMNFCANDVTLQSWIDYQYKKDISTCNVRIDPMPPHIQENSCGKRQGLSTRTNKRKLNTEFEKQQELLKEDKSTPQPLNWIIRGIRNKGMFDSVWCVFDNDERNYHGLKQAFNEAKEHGINIAYSNRCIEYYFLQHFEYKYLAFEKCECRDKIINKSCKTDDQCRCVASTDLKYLGKTCINGYARYKGYWIGSKSRNYDVETKSIFELLSNRLMLGAYNSVIIRQNVAKLHPNVTSIWELNPYTDVEKLVLRLMGIYELERNCSLDFKDGSVITRVTNNNDSISFEIIQGSLSVINVYAVYKNSCCIIQSNNIRLTQKSLKTKTNKNQDYITIIQINGKSLEVSSCTNKIACI